MLFLVIGNWHNATDGRGITQLQRCKYNYEMLNYIVEMWLPWHKDCYDFSLVDINKYVYEFYYGAMHQV
jgi:hypothetical protein